MAGKARRSIARQDFAPVLNLFPLVSHLMAMRGEFERSLQGCDPSVRNRISGIIDVLHQTVSGRNVRHCDLDRSVRVWLYRAGLVIWI